MGLAILYGLAWLAAGGGLIAFLVSDVSSVPALLVAYCGVWTLFSCEHSWRREQRTQALLAIDTLTRELIEARRKLREQNHD